MHHLAAKTQDSFVPQQNQGHQHRSGNESTDIIAQVDRKCSTDCNRSFQVFSVVFAQCLPGSVNQGGAAAKHNNMRCNVLRFTISSLVIILIILQLIHLSMISWLENRTAKRKTSSFLPRKEGGGGGHILGPAAAGGGGMILRQDKVLKPMKFPAAFRIPDAKLDTSGSYKIYPYYMKSATMDSRDIHKEYKDVTLVTQCSLHHLAHIVDLVDRWKGLISVAIFGLASEVDTISTVMLTLRECYPGIKQNVSFHLVHPITEIIEGKNAKEATLTKLPCDSILTDLWERKLLTQNYAQEGIPYPNNLLRNVARAGTSSKFVLVVDIDMLPSSNMRTGFLHLAHNSIILQEETEYSRKTAFVVPAFELRDGVPMPTDKADLLESIRQDNARQFYVRACSYCQNHTDYQKWENIQGSPGMLNIAYSVEWRPLWEPFYISHRNVPLYDERFKQYGFNRISQVCEMHVAGYNFVVLDTGFIVHKGYKEKDKFHARKDDENRRNKQLFFQLQSELQVKYPESTRKCQ